MEKLRREEKLGIEKKGMKPGGGKGEMKGGAARR